jgi:hypothetical protein
MTAAHGWESSRGRIGEKRKLVFRRMAVRETLPARGPEMVRRALYAVEYDLAESRVNRAPYRRERGIHLYR